MLALFWSVGHWHTTHIFQMPNIGEPLVRSNYINEHRISTESRSRCIYPLFVKYKIDSSNSETCEILLSKALKRGRSFIQPHFHSLDLSLLKPLKSQVGGLGASKKRVLTWSSSIHGHSIVLKPLREDHRGIREIAFYEQLSTLHNDDEMERAENTTLNIFAEFIPNYHGVVMLHTICDKNHFNNTHCATSDRYILLQDVTFPFQKPHVLDIKMGQQTWEPGETSHKMDIETSKYPMQQTYGFRIVGMRTFTWDASSASSVIQSFDKHYGRSLETRDQVSNALKLFFSTLGHSSNKTTTSPISKINVEAIHMVLNQLYRLQSCFERNKCFAFFASSILIVVEGCPTRVQSRNGYEAVGPLAVVKMIDFGHVRKGMGGDGGYQHGIATLCDILENIVRTTINIEQE